MPLTMTWLCREPGRSWTELDGVGVTEGWVAKLQPRKSEEIMKFITLWNRNLEDPLIKMIISYNDCCTIDLIYVLLFMF